jgi:hypothetical protein
MTMPSAAGGIGVNSTPPRRFVPDAGWIVARLALALELQLPEVEAARLKRVPAVNPDAEDLAFQCVAAVQTASFADLDQRQSAFLNFAASSDPEVVFPGL